MVANSLNFLNEDPRLQSRGQAVRRVVFPDYSGPELVEIVNFRLKKAKNELKTPLPEQIMNFAALRITQKGGDLREFLDVLPRIVADADGPAKLENVQAVLGRAEISPLCFS